MGHILGLYSVPVSVSLLLELLNLLVIELNSLNKQQPVSFFSIVCPTLISEDMQKAGLTMLCYFFVCYILGNVVAAGP